MGKGFLTGKIDAATTFAPDDFRASIPRFAAGALAANQVLIDLLARVAARHSATPAQIALAWLMAQKPWIVPLFGTRKINRFDENIGALNVRLTFEDLSDIQTANIQIKGARYPAEMLAKSGL